MATSAPAGAQPAHLDRAGRALPHRRQHHRLGGGAGTRAQQPLELATRRELVEPAEGGVAGLITPLGPRPLLISYKPDNPSHRDCRATSSLFCRAAETAL